MYFDMNGVTFTRLQNAGSGASADPLAPEVLFDGRFLGGLCMFKQIGVNAGGVTATATYTVPFGRTLGNPPIVLGTVRLAQAYVDNSGVRWFEANEFVSPCLGTYFVANQGRSRNFEFSYSVSPSQIDLTISGFVGTASFLIVELD